MTEKPKIISLYTGAGGLDYGFEAAGFSTKVAVEMDPSCVLTLKKNRSWPVIAKDIHDVSAANILKAAGLRKSEADLLIGGPPCQPFSKNSYWVRGHALRLGDPRASTLKAYFRILSETLPKVFVLETVEGMAYDGKDEGLQLLLRSVEQINLKTKSRYVPVVCKLNTAHYGVPQVRRRVIVIGARDGKLFEPPKPTHGDEPDTEPYRTAWDALGDTPLDPLEDLTVRGRWADLLPSIPEGHNYLWHTDRMGGLPLFGWRCRYWSFLLKLAKNHPCSTIQANPGPAVGPFHWDSRRLSIRELCNLQTFPDDIQIVGNRSSQQRQVGNAVPSLLAEVIGRAIRVQLLGLAALRSPLKLLPPDRSPIPAATRRRPVPEKYRPLIGLHKPHPGTGKGPRALLRPSVPA